MPRAPRLGHHQGEGLPGRRGHQGHGTFEEGPLLGVRHRTDHIDVGMGLRRVDHRAGQHQPEGALVALLVGREEVGQQGRALVAIDPSEADEIGVASVTRHRDRVGRTVGGSRVVHTQSEQELAMGRHREPPLHQLPFGRGLEDQPVGGAEHPREDRQSEGGLVVGGRVEDGRCPDPVDEPHGRVVQVRVEDQCVGFRSGTPPRAAPGAPVPEGRPNARHPRATLDQDPRAALPKRGGTKDRGRRRRRSARPAPR